MKPRTRKPATKNRAAQPQLPTFGELLREEFLKPLGISRKELDAVVSPWWTPAAFWWSLGQEPMKDPTGDFLFAEYALLLDRVLGMPDGYFLQLWATCTSRIKAKRMRPWLAKVRPIDLSVSQRTLLEKARQRLIAEGLVPVDDTHGRPTQRKANIYQRRKLQRTHQLADWAERKFARTKNHSP